MPSQPERRIPLGIEECRILFDLAPMLVWRSGLDGNCDYFNARWLAFTGCSAGEQPIHWTHGVHPEDIDRCVAVYLGQCEWRERFDLECRLRRFDGTYREVSVHCVPYADARGAFAGFLATSVELERREASLELPCANEFFEMSIDNVCVAGLDGYFKRLNPSWTRTLGWTAEELMSRPSAEFVHPEDREATLAGRRQLAAGGVLGPLTNRYLCKDGTYRWFEWRSGAHVDRRLVYAVARDITEQKLTEVQLAEAKEREAKLERQLVFADRMASVGTLAAGVAHEVNNPLAYVSANISLMLDSLHELGSEVFSPRLPELCEMAVAVQEGAERIRKTVRGLKTFSRAEQERRTVIELRPLLELSINMAFNEIRHRARLVKDYGPTPPVEADEARLGQVFINLLVNAAQAIPEGRSDGNEIRVVTSTSTAGRAVIEVRDTGVGIPTHLISRIFDPFFTTKPVGAGTGLGLSICHSIVSALGGEITVTSQERAGTVFRLELPAATGVPAAAVVVAAPKKALARARVLVLDDEPAIGSVLRRILCDHDVTLLTTAQEALQLLASGNHFDVILSDLMMPGMSGMEFHAELTRTFPQLVERVVFISGGAFSPNATAFLEQAQIQCIEKPFDARSVLRLVRGFVR
ncbi:MAG: ATP-binding protein [Deltaproteobacteria bacterium]